VFPAESQATTHFITIKDQAFKPDHLKIKQGDTVEWCLLANAQSDADSLYYEKSRSHVVSFDSINFESPLVRISNRGIADRAKTTFRITFFNEGQFDFCCRIYTWMKGQVQVQYNHLGEIVDDKGSALVKAAINCDKSKAQAGSGKIPGVVDFK